MAHELRTSVYPSRLSDSDLTNLQSSLLRHCSDYPQFSFWLVGVLQDEQVRRLEQKPVERFGVPVNWPGSVLAQALTVVTCLTYHPPSSTAGKFADSLLACINALAATKLEYVQ